MMRLAYFALFSWFLTYCYGDVVICNSLEDYDTLSLTKAKEWQFSSADHCLDGSPVGCIFYFSFCQIAPHCQGDFAACQTQTMMNTVILGNVSHNDVFNANGKNGFEARFPSGPMQNITNTTHCAPSLLIKFACDENNKWLLPIGNATGNAPAPTSIQIDPANSCSITVNFGYSGACWKSDKPPGDKISGGAVVLIIFFSIACIYIIGGVTYNAFVQHRSGIMLIPNAPFWISLPLNAIEGVRFSISICLRSSTPSRASYQSV